MSSPTAALFCPGRGSYGREELGSITGRRSSAELSAVLVEADAARTQAGEPTITDLDSADSFRPSRHLEGRNAAELIYFATMAHVEDLRRRYEIVAVAGNSLGWYTALAASKVLDLRTGWRLVRRMAELQGAVQGGGQLLTTTLNSNWQHNEEWARAIDAAMADRRIDPEHPAFAAVSIRLGGHVVIAGTDTALDQLQKELPQITVGERKYPFRLAGHGPFHTPLCRAVSLAALPLLMELPACAPAMHLIDGRGDLHTPWSADPEMLLRYTATQQVVDTFDFAAAVRVAIRECNPETLLCAGPGSSLRAPVGHVVLAEGFRGMRSREQLFESTLVRMD